MADIICKSRGQNTKQTIFEAFAKLLPRKSFSRITVKEIMDNVGMDRMSFYEYFSRKDKLLKQFYLNLFEHIYSRDLKAELTHDFSMAAGDPKMFIAHILYHLYPASFSK